MRPILSTWTRFGITVSLLTTSVSTSSVGPTHRIKCQEGSDVQFPCPCCSSRFNGCRFKKLYEEGYIVYHGKVNRSRYQVAETKSHITLKDCNFNDEGIYFWVCRGCAGGDDDDDDDDVLHFILEVQLQR